MLPADLEKFNQAIFLAQQEQKEAARALIIELLRRYPHEANLLLWFAFTTPSPTQARLALSKARVLEPDNPTLDQASAWLEQQGAIRPPTTPVVQPALPASVAFRPNPRPAEPEIDLSDFLISASPEVDTSVEQIPARRFSLSLRPLKFWRGRSSASISGKEKTAP